MAEASPLSAANALRAWMAAPLDAARLQELLGAAGAGPVDATAVVKLPIAVLSAWRSVKMPPLQGFRPHVRQAVLACGIGANVGIQPTPEEARELEGLPFTVSFSSHEILVQVQPTQQGQRFGSPFLHQWIAGVHADAVVIDCSRLNHVNSVLIAWMLQMVQSAKPTAVRIRHAKTQVVTQLKQLRLDHLMLIES